jgi:hypothetical protein
MKKIYVIKGNSGGRDSFEEWCVAAYLDAELAKKHAKAAEKRADEIFSWRDSEGKGFAWSKDPNRPTGENEFDPYMCSIIGTSIRYSVEEVDFFERFGK